MAKMVIKLENGNKAREVMLRKESDGLRLERGLAEVRERAPKCCI